MQAVRVDNAAGSLLRAARRDARGAGSTRDTRMLPGHPRPHRRATHPSVHPALRSVTAHLECRSSALKCCDADAGSKSLSLNASVRHGLGCSHIPPCALPAAELSSCNCAGREADFFVAPHSRIAGTNNDASNARTLARPPRATAHPSTRGALARSAPLRHCGRRGSWASGVA